MDAPRNTIDRARSLRATMSLPEVLLWKALRRGQLDGLRFRRQHPIGRYVLDFYCDDVRLAVEVDGLSHSMGDRPVRDQRRDTWLAEQDVRVLRLPAALVLDDMEATLRTILNAVRP